MVRSGTDDNILDIFDVGGADADFDLSAEVAGGSNGGRLSNLSRFLISRIFESDLLGAVHLMRLVARIGWQCRRTLYD